jgi:hypothetical protein
MSEARKTVENINIQIIYYGIVTTDSLRFSSKKDIKESERSRRPLRDSGIR